MEYCGFTTCTTDAQCGGSTCADQRWCIHEFYCGRWRPDGPVPMTSTYEGSCAKGETCAKGTCKTVRACQPKSAQGDRAQGDRSRPSGDGAVPPARGCSCGVAEVGREGGAPLCGLLAAGLLLGWRRRRARAARSSGRRPTGRCLDVLALAVPLCLAGASTARADVVGPSTLQCPEGFSVQRCHGSEYCGFTACTTDAQCGGSPCAEQRWCISEFYCGRWRPDATVPMTRAYGGSCANGEPCKEGTCQTVRACTPPPDRGCACRIGRAPGAGLAALALLGLAIGLVVLCLRRRT
jgi:MYXO-CTERM domain-containing protein